MGSALGDGAVGHTGVDARSGYSLAGAMQQQYNMFGIKETAQPFPIASFNSQPDGFYQLSTFHTASADRQNFQLLPTPGHTQGSVCLYFPKEKILFSGDTLFRMGFGRTDLPGGNYGQLMDSLEQLFALPEDTAVYPGHGEPTTIGAERHRW